MKIYNSHRHKTAVWRPIHSAGCLMRLGGLAYYRCVCVCGGGGVLHGAKVGGCRAGLTV
jgi:hypothetical protein